MQPILPLLEYHIFKQSIIELLCEERDIQESDCDGICYLTNQIQKSEDQNRDRGFSADFYPGYVQFEQPEKYFNFPERLPSFEHAAYATLSTALFLKSPPPKVS